MPAEFRLKATVQLPDDDFDKADILMRLKPAVDTLRSAFKSAGVDPNTVSYEIVNTIGPRKKKSNPWDEVLITTEAAPTCSTETTKQSDPPDVATLQMAHVEGGEVQVSVHEARLPLPALGDEFGEPAEQFADEMERIKPLEPMPDPPPVAHGRGRRAA